MRTVIHKRYSSDFKARAVEMLNLGRSVPDRLSVASITLNVSKLL